MGRCCKTGPFHRWWRMGSSRVLTILLVLIFAVEALCFDVSFDGHAVLSCDVNDEARAQEMQSAAKEQGLDVWTHHMHKGRPLHVQVSPQRRAWWEEKFGCRTYIEDVQEMIDQQFKHAAIMQGIQGVESLVGEGEGIGQEWFSKYHKFASIVSRTKELADAHPKLAKFVPTIGKSHEGRHIPVIHLSGAPHPDKPQIWLNGGQHAREWIAPAVVMYMTQKLLADYSKDPQVKKLMDKFEFVIAPVINPDGYDYTFTGNRLWRKNRRNNGDGSMGVDLNRNWSNHWGKGGASKDPSAIDYQGPSAASEPEVAACQKYIMNLKHRVAGIDFHSYGQLILRSKGWTKKKSKDERLLLKMATDMKSAISKVRGTQYSSEVAAGLYPTTGSTDDWMSEEGKMWGHGWTVELPGPQGGHHGFLLPASQILTSSKEMYQGLLSFVQNLYDEHEKRGKMGVNKWRHQWRERRMDSNRELEGDMSHRLQELRNALVSLEKE